jgi:hypothetical protein
LFDFSNELFGFKDVTCYRNSHAKNKQIKERGKNEQWQSGTKTPMPDGQRRKKCIATDASVFGSKAAHDLIENDGTRQKLLVDSATFRDVLICSKHLIYM